jgi:hypothetical protein
MLARVKHHTRLRIHDYDTVAGLRNVFLVYLISHCGLFDAAIVRVAAASWWAITHFVANSFDGDAFLFYTICARISGVIYIILLQLNFLEGINMLFRLCLCDNK